MGRQRPNLVVGLLAMDTQGHPTADRDAAMTDDPNLRAQCAELIKAIESVQDWGNTYVGECIDKLEDALSTPPITPVTDRPDFREPIAHSAYVAFVQICKGGSDDAGTYEADEELVRSALKRLDALEKAALNTPTLAPVPVSERLPGAEDCRPNPRNGQGQWCWGLTGMVPGIPYSGSWRMMPLAAIVDEAFYWLPHWAIPLPEESK